MLARRSAAERSRRLDRRNVSRETPSRLAPAARDASERARLRASHARRIMAPCSDPAAWQRGEGQHVPQRAQRARTMRRQ